MTSQALQEDAVLPSIACAPRASTRLSSIDAFRGLVMLLMMAEVLAFARVARQVPKSKFWALLAHHQSHVAWIGCSLHDLIQPSFSFLVGVALPFSLAKRVGAGQSAVRRTLHGCWRASILILLGVFLRSVGQRQTNWTFEDTLTQIGLGYVPLYLLAGRSRRVQWTALAVILIGYWLAFAIYPTPDASFDWKSVGVLPGSAAQLSGFAAHWSMNSNAAWAFDRWFLNLFSRPAPFVANSGGYCTLSFIPTLATMILGLLAGGVLRGERPTRGKLHFFFIASVLMLAIGWALGAAGVCPVVKRIWTPSWVLFSGGWCYLLLASFYAILDGAQLRRWAYPLIVVGMNSIAAYLMAHLCPAFIHDSLITHFHREVFRVAGSAYEPLLLGAAVLLIEWLILWWMYRRKLFLKI
jgi:predicted acyltransferase